MRFVSKFLCRGVANINFTKFYQVCNNRMTVWSVKFIFFSTVNSKQVRFAVLTVKFNNRQGHKYLFCALFVWVSKKGNDWLSFPETAPYFLCLFRFKLKFQSRSLLGFKTTKKVASLDEKIASDQRNEWSQRFFYKLFIFAHIVPMSTTYCFVYYKVEHSDTVTWFSFISL